MKENIREAKEKLNCLTQEQYAMQAIPTLDSPHYSFETLLHQIQAQPGKELHRANIETDIINYFHALGIQMKTDPLMKKDEFLNSQTFILIKSVNSFTEDMEEEIYNVQKLPKNQLIHREFQMNDNTLLQRRNQMEEEWLVDQSLQCSNSETTIETQSSGSQLEPFRNTLLIRRQRQTSIQVPKKFTYQDQEEIMPYLNNDKS